MKSQSVSVKAINGVNIEQLGETVEKVTKQPDLAAFQFRACGRWLDGARNSVTIDGFYGAGAEHVHATPFVVEADEPQPLLGRDLAANPVELLLGALSACLTTSIVYHAAAKGITLNAVESRLEGDIDLQGFLGLRKDVRRGYEQIRMYFKIDADVPEAELEELMKLGPTFSPVYDSITNGVPVTVALDRSGSRAAA